MKPTVFNYQEYERVVEENKKLNAEVADLRIRCRIADGDKRDCKSCKHQKPDGCSRWNCEYEPAKSDLISRADAIEAIASRDETDGTVKAFTGREVNEILSALPSAEPCDKDAISRDGLLKSWEELSPRGRTEFDQVIMTIPALPSADRLTGWIPTSERLPDIGDTYLVTVMVGKEIRTDVADSFGSYIDGFWDTFNDWIEDEECHVIAWMPLPEPYKGGDTE